MSKYLVEGLNQKFEIKGYRLYFDLQHSVAAEEMLNYLDRATSGVQMVFGLDEPPAVEIFLYPDLATIERVTQKPMSMGETVRFLPDEGILMLGASHLPKNLGEDIVRQLCYLLFNAAVKEREIGIRTYRTPSWLREGICLQVPYKIRPDSKEFLVSGWNICLEALKAEQLIKPSVMAKSLHLIPDANRRQLATFQAFFMVRLLISNYSDKFFKKYATLMAVLEDADAENVFRQVTTLDFDKFFGLYKDWVRTTNVWAAISD